MLTLRYCHDIFNLINQISTIASAIRNSTRIYQKWTKMVIDLPGILILSRDCVGGWLIYLFMIYMIRKTEQKLWLKIVEIYLPVPPGIFSHNFTNAKQRFRHCFVCNWLIRYAIWAFGAHIWEVKVGVKSCLVVIDDCDEDCTGATV